MEGLGEGDLLSGERSGFGWCAEREVGGGGVRAPRRDRWARAAQAGEQVAGERTVATWAARTLVQAILAETTTGDGGPATPAPAAG